MKNILLITLAILSIQCSKDSSDIQDIKEEAKQVVSQIEEPTENVEEGSTENKNSQNELLEGLETIIVTKTSGDIKEGDILPLGHFKGVDNLSTAYLEVRKDYLIFQIDQEGYNYTTEQMKIDFIGSHKRLPDGKSAYRIFLVKNNKRFFYKIVGNIHLQSSFEIYLSVDSIKNK